MRAAGQPIPGAVVTAVQGKEKLSTVTDESGQYSFETVYPGTWEMAVEIFGFVTATRQVQISGTPAPIDWTLELRPRTPVRALPNRGQQARGQGFENLTLNPNADALMAEAAPAATESGNANEAFLVNGSLSQALGAARPDEGLGPNFRGGGGFGDQGGFGPGAGGAPGAGGQVPGFGGGGGPGGGGPGGGRFPAGGGGGGRPGFGGGPGGRARGAGGGPPGGAFGNRAGRANRDTIRGAVFFTVGNSALNARPFSLTGQELANPAYGSERFGLSAGGALKIPHLINSPKTFFFLNYTGLLSRTPYSAFATLPTTLERGGNFSQSVNGGPAAIYDPTTHAPFPDGIIPQARIDPVALGLLAYIPTANQPGSVQNYQNVRSVPQNTENLNLRVNRPITKKDQLDFNFNLQQRNGHSAQLYGFTDEVTGLGMSSTVGWTHNFGPTLFNVLRWNFSRNRSETVPAFANGANVAEQIGINGTSPDPINFGPPNLSFTNYGGLTDASPTLTRNQTSGVTDSVTKVHGVHTISFGGEFRRVQLNLKTDQNGRGTYSFSGLLTSAFGANGQPLPNTGYDFADFLLGFPQSSSIRFGTSSNYFRSWATNEFVQDDWRVRPNLTLNLGVRYEYFNPFTEKYGRLANLDIAPDFSAVAVVTPDKSGPYSGAFPAGLVNPDRNNFSPRLGLAWKPWAAKQFLVRMGYSIFYNGSIYTQFPSQLASQPPFAASSATLVTSVADPLTIANGFASAPSNTITNTYAVDKNYRVGYAQTWNIFIQQSLPHSLVLEVGYLGTKGTRLDIQDYPNRAAPGSPLSSEERLQIGNATGFIFDTSDGNSIYHSGQVRFTRRFSRGISANVLYTYSKSIDNASTLGGGATVVAQNENDLSAERGLSSFDQRHKLAVNYIYTSPVGENGLLRGGGVPEKLLKDWTFTGSVTAATGTPLTARVLGNQSDTAGTGAVGSGRADATGAPIDSSGGFFNLAAFTLPVAGEFGNAGRNTIPGPGLFSLNLSLSRSFRMGDDRRRVEFRVDTTNITNHVSITNVYTVVNASNYGLASAASGMRTITGTVRFRF